jgi:hypothetical protein
MIAAFGGQCCQIAPAGQVAVNALVDAAKLVGTMQA